MNPIGASVLSLFWGMSLIFLGLASPAFAADAPQTSSEVKETASAPKADAQTASLQILEDLNALVARDAFDELYLRGSALFPQSFSTGERSEIGAVLLSGAQKMSGRDGALAFGLTELSLKFSETVAGLSTASDLALTLGEASLAATYLERARHKDPVSDELKLKQGALAEFSKDWGTAQKAYGEIGEKSDLYGAAQGALVRISELQRAEDDAAVEKAKRDFEKRLDAADDMIAAMPVSEFDLCRAHTLAACEAVTACRKAQANCTFLLESCPKSRRQVNISRSKLSKCAVALAALPCEKVETSIPELSSGACFGLLLRTSKELMPSEVSTTDEKKRDSTMRGHEKTSLEAPPSTEDVQRILNELHQRGI